MRIDVETCQDIDLLRREAIRLQGVIKALVGGQKCLNEEIEELKQRLEEYENDLLER